MRFSDCQSLLIRHMDPDAPYVNASKVEDCFEKCDNVKQLYKWMVAVVVAECAVGVDIESRHITCSRLLSPLLELMEEILTSQDNADLRYARQTMSRIWIMIREDSLTAAVSNKKSFTPIDWLNSALSDELCKEQCRDLIDFESEKLSDALQEVNTKHEWQTQKLGATNCLIQFAIFKKIESCLVESKRLWNALESVFVNESEKQYFYLLKKAAQFVPAVHHAAFVCAVMLAFFGNSQKLPQLQIEELEKAQNASTRQMVDAVCQRWNRDAALLSVDTKTSKKQKRKQKSTSTASVTFSQTVVSEAANSEETLIPQRRKRIAVKV